MNVFRRRFESSPWPFFRFNRLLLNCFTRRLEKYLTIQQCQDYQQMGLTVFVKFVYLFETGYLLINVNIESLM